MKASRLVIHILLVLLVTSCSKRIVTEPLYSYVPPGKEVRYEGEVKPILEKRCVICHSCYNSPCQLKFSSWEGIDRGASKERIYNADRLSAMEPSRLFIDAMNTPEWREKGFYPVKPEENGRSYDDTVMFLLLDHKRKNPSPLKTCNTNESFEAEAEDLACPETTAEVDNFLRTHPNRGMPFGFPPLSKQEFNLVVGWMTQGAPGPTEEEQAALKAVPDSDQEWIDTWEAFLNTKKPKHRLSARYLYEHLFLAHINFKPDSDTFYELVRSNTPPGEDIDIIATRRPYDSPGTTKFFYRFRKIHSTLVHKTHMVFTMDRRQLELVDRLFITTKWEGGPYRLDFDPVVSANPFESFRRIPVRSRYEWLLDNAHYVIMTFIRGPVCKGQVALNVINDHFWLFFMDPDYDISVTDPDFLKQYATKLRMPAEEGSGLRLLRAILFYKHKYKPWVEAYYKARQDKYFEAYPGGLGPEAIWIDSVRGRGAGGSNAERDQPQSILTVFRHFDSASVHRGPLGKPPKTVWVVDYPILERIYYSLVAGFDVYGTKGHQGTTRKYMDSLRIEAESAFLEFMPPDSRGPMMDNWYQKLETEEDLYYYPTKIPAPFFPESVRTFNSQKEPTEEANEEFKQDLLRYLVGKMGMSFDRNHEAQTSKQPTLPDTYGNFEGWVRGFQAVSEKENSFIKRVADHNANVAWVKVRGEKVHGENEDRYFTVFVDRWHDNVNYIEKEDLRLNPEKDKVDILDGLYGSYPNYFFVVDRSEMGRFIKILYEYDGSDRDVCMLETFGINRAEPDFWEVYDDFQEAFNSRHKERAGLIDLNRYYSLAMQKRLYEGGTSIACEAVAEQIRKETPWWKRE